ncbi:MAG: condensation domain-containing protein, partial [Microcystaceae cyanobacterium]
MTQYISEESLTATDNSILDVSEEDVFVFPTSFTQERLWLLEQLKGERPVYNSSCALHLIGPLYIASLEQALKEIVQRHEVLRTTFPVMDGSPVQAIHPTFNVSLLVLDWQALPKESQFEEVQRLALDEARRPFDLANGPLICVTLLQLAKESHVLLVTMHHMVSDGWSIGIFIRELSTLYQAFRAEASFPLPDLPIQYADFADWQRQWLTGEVLETQLNYWKQHLAGAPPLIELPIDCPRPPVQSFRGTHHSIILPKTLVASLNDISIRQGVTLFVALLSALKILLFRWTGQTDLVVGTVIAGRNRSETELLIGCFINFLALRSQVSAEQSVLEFLKQVGTTVFEAYSHQDCPFEKVVEALNPDRKLSHNPIYNVAFLLQNFPLQPYFGDGLEIRPVSLDTDSSLLDLRFVVYESSEQTIFDCEYNSDLFEAETIERMTGHFQT